MSEPRLISPMLDNFAMGGPISDHDGVRCYPAMENDTNDKYIVKVISIPASSTQLEALLLTGAYPSKEAALVYFKDLADGVVDEIQILNKLSDMEGFLPYKAFQTVPMVNDSGYEVYMLGSYKRVLSKQFVKHPLTQLQAINLGLDLCAALSVCRRAGYLYIALKPNNVYVTADNQYKIGDLGFVSLKSLKYASLPDKYRSAYTPPEISDAFSALNETIDVYAAGLILYQAYNNGALPDMENFPQEPFQAPAYADYEMSEIILKACAPNPEDRWQDPMEMGQALVSYMQKYGADDIPIIPPVVVPVPEEQPASEEISEPEPDNPETPQEDTEEPVAAEDTSEEPEENPEEETEPDPTSPSSDEETPEEPTDSDETLNDMDFLGEETDDPEVLDIAYEEVSDEVNEMLSQADELVSHPVPEPVVQPEPIDVPIPDPIIPEPEAEESPESENPESENTDVTTDEDTSGTEQASDDSDDDKSADETDETSEDEEPENADTPRKKKRWVPYTLIALAVAALLAGGFYFYKSYYLLPIHALTLDGDRDTLTVLVDTDVDESLLQVVCADTYGTKISVPVADGKAEFHDLVPNTGYTISLTASGFHHLSGETSATYSTPVQTEIVQFSAVTGQEDGSVILGLTIEGPDASQWNVTYSAEDEEEKKATFTSHTATITGLTLGKEYTFRLSTEDDLYVTGPMEVKHVASALVYAKDLQITSCENGTLTATWSAPEDINVESWSVRCYDGDAYNKSVIVDDTTVTFDELDSSKGYTVEVTAAGMSVAEKTSITENSITVTDFQVDTTDPHHAVVSWNSSHPVPADGWILSYTIDGSGEQEVLICEENSATLLSAVPGSVYRFTIKTLEENMVIGVPSQIQIPEADAFSCNYDGYAVAAEDMSFHMCKTPAAQNWNRYNLLDSDYTTTFAPGQKASFLVHLDKSYGTSSDEITTLFVIRDESGAFVSADRQSRSWSDMWYRNYCELDISALPTTPGNYTISTYWNGALANEQDFVIAE